MEKKNICRKLEKSVSGGYVRFVIALLMISQIHLLFPSGAFAGVYDFSGGSSDTDRMGYWYNNATWFSLNTANGPDIAGQYNMPSSAYSSMASSDGVHYVSTTTSNGTDIIQHFTFVISDATDTITQIYVEWTGKGKDTAVAGKQNCRLKLYQFPSIGALEVASNTDPISQVTISSTITSGFLKFISTATHRLDVYVTGGNSDGTAAEVWTDYVKVAISTLADGTSPSSVTDLAAGTGLDEGHIHLTWTAPGDDGASGNISGGKFAVQYSTYEVSWSTSTAQIVRSTSTAAGEIQSYAVTGLTAGATYYFRIWSADEVPNWSALSNGATAQAGLLATNITEASFDFGNIALNGSAVSASSAAVVNTGNMNATYQIKLSTPPNWSAGTVPGADEFVFYVIFNSAQPFAGNFGAEDVLSTTTASCTATVFAGDENGLSVPPGAKRGMWAYFKAPTATSVETQQAISVTITPLKP